MEGYRYAGRKKLSSRRSSSKPVDIEYVYRQNDLGRSIREIAEELGVSRSTLRRRHIRYQEEAKLMEGRGDGDGPVSQRDGKDPFAFLDD